MHTMAPPLSETSADAAGFDADRLAEAVGFAAARETAWSRDLAAQIELKNRESHEGEFAKPRGPVLRRGPCSGLVLRDGLVAAAWGQPSRRETTFSVAKSYLAMLAGIALGDGLIGELDEPVARTVDDGGFEPPHNHAITWRQLLNQTSEWQGTLWGIPDSIDWNRAIGADPAAWPPKGSPRLLHPPGAYFEYNDVRVNRLALCLLRLFRRPLPEVLRTRVMDPIGASRTWEWHGYDEAWVTIDGLRMASVTGGSHWGGGMMINSYDHARFGLLHLWDGVWQGTRILPDGWVKTATTPSPLRPDYGLLWWLNTGAKARPSLPADCFWAAGDGGHTVFVHQPTRLVVVARWLDRSAHEPFLARVLASLSG
jgi:CubicO group peptidase (beta-lactamase class C family)